MMSYLEDQIHLIKRMSTQEIGRKIVKFSEFMTQTTDQERAQFEAWCDKNEYDRAMRMDGTGYNNEKTKRAWVAWQAGRSTLAAQVHEAVQRAALSTSKETLVTLTKAVPWLLVVDEAMVNAHLGVVDISDDYATAKRKLNSLISWEIDVSKHFDTDAPKHDIK